MSWRRKTGVGSHLGNGDLPLYEVTSMSNGEKEGVSLSASTNREPRTRLLQGQTNIAAARDCIALPRPARMRELRTTLTRLHSHAFTVNEPPLHFWNCSFVKTSPLVPRQHVK